MDYNQRQTFEALLRGETVTGIEGETYRFSGRSLMKRFIGVESVSCAFECGTNRYVEPNPHPKGSFNWARHENKTRAVERDLRDGRLASTYKPGGMLHAVWVLEAIDAMDWVHS